MARQVDLAVYVPPVIQSIQEFIQIFKAENVQINEVLKQVESVTNDQYIYNATDYGISRWEKIIGIRPRSGDSLEDRRFTVLSKLNAKLPYTYRTLEQRLIALVGEDGFTMRYVNATYTLYVRVALSQQKQYEAILNVLNETVPANIIIDYGLLDK